MSYELYQQKMAEIKQLNSISALLSWDMEVKMPHGSDKSFRADQTALISGLSHEKYTSSDLEAIVSNLAESIDLTENQKREVIVSKREIAKAKKLTKAFVEKESKLTSEAYSQWEKAKNSSDFNLFQPSLTKIVDLLIEKN